jgi:L-ascorbate metabolism protein UlaG (beta-lactamase superfamily)
MTVRVTYIGHATVLLDIDGTRLLTDPVLRGRTFGIIRRAGETPDVGEAPDAVIVSHLHPDHLDYKSLRLLDPETPVVAARGSARLFRRRGMRTIHELEPGEPTTIGGVEIRATPAVHEGRRYPIGPKIPALGYEIRGAGARIYFAGDTDLFDDMADLAGVDIALLPIAGWGPSVGKGHLDPERASKAAALIRPRVLIPIHWGALLRSDLHRRRPELLSDPATELAEIMSREAPEVDVRVLAPGESFELQA